MTMIEAFTQGYLEGVRMYAVWNNGVQEVGVRRRPYSDIGKDILAGKDEAFNDVKAVYEMLMSKEERS